MDVKISVNPAYISLNSAEPQLVSEAQARQAENSTVRTEVPFHSNSDGRNLCSKAEDPDVVILESTTAAVMEDSAAVQSSHEDRFALEIVVPQDTESDEEKPSVGETPGSQGIGTKLWTPGKLLGSE